MTYSRCKSLITSLKKKVSCTSSQTCLTFLFLIIVFEVGLRSARSPAALTISCRFFEPPPAACSVPRLPFYIKAGDSVFDCQSVIDRCLPSASVGAGRGFFFFFIDGDINGEGARGGEMDCHLKGVGLTFSAGSQVNKYSRKTSAALYPRGTLCIPECTSPAAPLILHSGGKL